MVEQWKDVVGYEEYFMISNYGNVWQKRTNKILSQNTTPSGYKVIQTRFGGRSGKCKVLRIHRLVSEAFIDNPENKPFVNHIDGIKHNNILTNLEWVTASENGKHAFAIGLSKNAQGTDQLCAKFTEEQIKFIREVYTPHCKVNGARALAKRFNVSHRTISEIASGKRYKNVT